MNLQTVEMSVVVLISIICIILGIFVYFSNRKSLTNILFSLMAFTLVVWICSGYFSLTELSNQSLLLSKINISIIPSLLSIALLFTLSFIGSTIRKKTMLLLIPGVTLTALCLFTNLALTDLGSRYEISSEVGGIIYYIWAGLVVLMVPWLIFKKYSKSNDDSKKKMLPFLLGLLFFGGLNIIFNIAFPILKVSHNYYRIGDYSSIIFLFFTAYSIVKHQLFNIKLIATETIVVIISIALAIEIFISSNVTDVLIKVAIWITASIGGLQLVKSVKREIEQREQLAILAKKLEKANDHLKEVDKLKDDFLSMASHELNTPIAAIEGYLSMILIEKMAGEIPAKAKQYLDSVFKSSQRLANMVKDLLNVSRIESNRIHLIFEDKPIEDIIKQAVMEIMSKVREAHHTLTFEEPKKPMPKTWLDVTRITEVLINIMGNAIKYTDPGGKIAVRVTNDDQKIIIAIEDNGRGIPRDRQKGVFEKFTQVDVLKDQVKGTGLGMYISKKFIELHKGKIWFHSDGEGKGTTFYFSIPIIGKKPFDSHEGEGSVLH